MKNIQIILLLLILNSGCNSVLYVSDARPKVNDDTEFVDDLFKNYSKDQPSATIIVIKNGEIALARSYGYADLENNILATPQTNYRIASVTKQFTAMAIMILVNQGKLTYETNLKEIFPDFPAYGKEITITQLLAHRSGLVKYNRFLKEGQTEQMLDKDVLNGLLNTDSTYFKPNSKYAYCNTSYAVMAQIVEKLSGLSFADFMQKEIFQPLDMTNSMIFEKDKEIKNRAYGYVVKDTSIILRDQSLVSAIQGDGGIYSSVMDYYKWDQALYTDKLLPLNKLDAAFYNYDENGISNDRGYGYGWIVNYYKGIKILQHGGSSIGFGSHVIRIPSENISVAIFTNRSKKGQELANRAKALISHYTNGKFQMPFQIALEKEIDKNGIESGIEMYNQIKSDTLNYSVSKEALFYFGISYINNNKNFQALKIFSCLESDYPSYFGGYYGSAVIYEKEKNIEKAMEYCNLTIKYCNNSQEWAAEHSQKMLKELTK
ncbi:MAG: serine hydrolase domain-containing protein [Crocinitomicaceae bacterium]